MWQRVITLTLNNTPCSENITFPPRSSKVQTFTYIVELYFIGFLCLVGIFTNTVSIVVMRRDRERREALLLLQALAIADAFYLVIALFRYPLKYMITDDYTFQTMQLAVFPLLKTAQTVAIFMMVFVTVDRYVYVCMPLRAHCILNRRKRCLIALCIILFGFFFNLPRFIDTCIIKYFDTCGNILMTAMVYTYPFNQPLYFDLYQCALYLIVLYVIPLVSLICINCKLIIAIRRSRRRHRPFHHHGHDHHDHNATLVLVIIVLVFIICETPELALRIAIPIIRYVKKIENSMDVGTHHQFATVVELLMVVNSSANFFIYCSFGRRFRQVLKETFQYRSGTSTQMTHESVPLQQQLYRG